MIEGGQRSLRRDGRLPPKREVVEDVMKSEQDRIAPSAARSTARATPTTNRGAAAWATATRKAQCCPPRGDPVPRQLRVGTRGRRTPWRRPGCPWGRDRLFTWLRERVRLLVTDLSAWLCVGWHLRRDLSHHAALCSLDSAQQCGRRAEFVSRQSILLSCVSPAAARPPHASQHD